MKTEAEVRAWRDDLAVMLSYDLPGRTQEEELGRRLMQAAYAAFSWVLEEYPAWDSHPESDARTADILRRAAARPEDN